MSPLRAVLDRLVHSRLPALLVALLLASQWTSLQHGVRHAPADPAAAAQASAKPAPAVPGSVAQEARPASAAPASPAHASVPGAPRFAATSHGTAGDPSGHAPGDGICLVLGHLLVDSPPAPGRIAVDGTRGASGPCWPLAALPAPHRTHRAQAARAPPLAIG